jgi:hypothetical protein
MIPVGGGEAPGRSDDGTVTPLLIAFALCLALMIAAVVDVSATFLRRQATASLADGAALSASDAAATASVYAGEGREFVPIDEDAARHAVAAYLEDSGAVTRYPGLRAAVQVIGGRTIVVELTMPYDLPISVPGSRDAIVIRVESSAELPVY